AATWNGQVFYKAPTGANGYKSHVHRWNGQYLSCQPIPDQLPQVSQCIQGIGFANSIALFGIHSGCFGHWITVRGEGAGQNGPIGCGPFNHPQGVSISVGASGGPGDGSVDASGGRGEVLGIDHHTGGGTQYSADVVSSGGGNTHDKRMCISDNRHSGRCTFQCDGQGYRPADGRYQSGHCITSEQHCDESRRGFLADNLLIKLPKWAGGYWPPPGTDKSFTRHPQGPTGIRVTSTDGTASTYPASRSQTSCLKSHRGYTL